MVIQGMPFVPGEAAGRLTYDPAEVSDSHILVLPYADTFSLERIPAGLVVLGGAPLAHPLIQLQQLGVPTVLLHARQGEALRAGEHFHLDGTSGVLGPAGPRQAGSHTRKMTHHTGRVRTRDGVPVHLRATVTGEMGAQTAREVQADAIGLVHSEYLTPALARMPDQAYYEKAFGAICQAAGPLPVTVRLLDISVDKKPAWLGELAGLTGLLGLQGSRLYDIPPVKSVVESQAAALATLARHYDLRVVIPFVNSPEEFRHWRNRLRRWLPPVIPLGPMVETPAAALSLQQLDAVADFVSIGTNDLMQCFFGADRDIPQVAGHLDPYAPSLYRLLQVATGDVNVSRVQLCGLLQQLPGVLPILIGLGFRRFSVSPRLVPLLSEVVAATDSRKAHERAERVCAARDSLAVRELLGFGQGGGEPAVPWQVGEVRLGLR